MTEARWHICETVEGLEAMRPQWEQVLRAADCHVPDVHPDRYIATIRSMADYATPYLAIAEVDGEPVALIAGRMERSSIRLRLGYASVRTPRMWSLVLFYNGLQSKPGSPGASLMHEHLQGLMDAKRARHILVNMQNTSREVYPLLTQMRGVVQQGKRLHWMTELVPGSFEKSMAHHSGKHRRNLRRLDRRLVEAFDDDVTIEVVTSREQIPEYQRIAGDIVDKTYKAGLASIRVDGQIWKDILEAEADGGRLRSYIMRGKGEPIAYHNGVVYEGVFWSSGMDYVPEYGHYRPGTVLMVRIFEDLCMDGSHAVDWGFGDAEYKRIMGTKSREEESMHLYGRGVRPTAARVMDILALRISALAKRALGSGFLSSIKKRWRDRLRKQQQQQQEDA